MEWNISYIADVFMSQVVLVCDNLLGQATTKCTYQQTIGTAFSESASQGMSVSGAVSNAIHAGLFRLFSEDLDISVTTGYDWTHVSEATQSEQITMKIEAEAPPGRFLFLFPVRHVEYSPCRNSFDHRAGRWSL